MPRRSLASSERHKENNQYEFQVGVYINSGERRLPVESLAISYTCQVDSVQQQLQQGQQ
jgi:hypothetical protein